MRIVYNEVGGPACQAFITPEITRAVAAFHASLPEYAPTPLRIMPKLASGMGIGALYVKDESLRFGLLAFKVLGASWAIESVIGAEPGKKHVFATATDGNHGRGVAWAAARAGCPAVVAMPKGSSEARVEAIRKLGARCFVTDQNYDDTVADLRRQAAENCWSLIQDTAWPGYEDIPAKIMQGYGTIVVEIIRQLNQSGALAPTHVFLQAGVGSLSAAIIMAMAALLPKIPKFVIVEPANADCIWRSLQARDLRTVGGALRTIMAGLACGRPSHLALPAIMRHAVAALSCPDAVAEEGMRLLAQNGDCQIISGESGAAPAGALARLASEARFAEDRARLGLDGNARVLLISTEGATDPQSWQKITGLPAPAM